MTDPSTAIAVGPAIVDAVQPLVTAAVVGLAVGIVNIAVSWWSKWTGQKLVLSQADNALIASAVQNEAGKIAAKLDASTFANLTVDAKSAIVADAANNIIGADAANLKAAVARSGITPSLVSSLVAGEVGKLQAQSTIESTGASAAK